MPISGGPGQQATPNAIRAIPVTRSNVMAMPVSSAPNSNCPINDGTISNATPVAASLAAAKTSTPFIAPVSPVLLRPGCGVAHPPLIARAGHCLLHLLAFLCRHLGRSEVEGELVDLAGELERDIVAILQQRDAGTRVLADVEGFVLRERDRSSVLHGIPGDLLTVHVE